MSKRQGPNKENLEETRRIFIRVATEEFCKYGYPNASTSRIVTESNMARGSLYYHFGDKNGLFRAVYTNILEESLITVAKEMDSKSDAWDALMAGSKTFLSLCTEDNFRKIVLIESQSALSYAERITIQSETLLGKLRSVLPELMSRGYFQGHTTDTIAVFIMGILGEIGRSFDINPESREKRQVFEQAYLQTMLTMKPENA